MGRSKAGPNWGIIGVQTRQATKAGIGQVLVEYRSDGGHEYTWPVRVKPGAGTVGKTGSHAGLLCEGRYSAAV